MRLTGRSRTSAHRTGHQRPSEAPIKSCHSPQTPKQRQDVLRHKKHLIPIVRHFTEFRIHGDRLFDQDSFDAFRQLEEGEDEREVGLWLGGV